MFESPRPRGSGCSPRLLVALVVAGVALFGYYSSQQQNPVTGEKQHVSLSTDQEIALGLQAAPELAQQHGGRARNRAPVPPERASEQPGRQWTHRCPGSCTTSVC